MIVFNVLFALQNVSPVAAARFSVLFYSYLEVYIMFSVGNAVIYDTQGVCVISEIASMNVGGAAREYYVLKPVYEGKSTLYIPTDNQEFVISHMRAVLTPSEIDDVILSVANQGSKQWISDDNKRKEVCGAVVKKGDRKELMSLVGMLYMKQLDMKSQKKHFHLSDERYLKEAEKLLHDEFAYVLGIERNKVVEYIADKLQKVKK